MLLLNLLLLDAYNVLFRSFSSLPRSITLNDGQPINAVYGMISGILKLVRDLDASYVVAAYDQPDVPTFRHRLYAPYQAQRGPLGGEHAEDFRRQVEVSRAVLAAGKVPCLMAPGYEADDIMGTLAARSAQAGGGSIVVSTDRDLLQLVRPGIEILVPGKDYRRVATDEDVRERMGVGPDGITSFKALAGDSSDNIPGVRGVGVKTAAALVNTYGDLAGIYNQESEILPRRVAAALAAEKENAFLFLQLVTVITDLPLTIEGEPAISDIWRTGKVREIIRLGGYDA